MTEAARWSDRIYVYDGESTDGTWEKVQAMQNETIVPWKRHSKVYHECLRGEVYNAFKHQAEAGDWWCRLDAGEFYLDSPRDFLARVKPQYHVVWGIAIAYYLTHEDNNSLDFTQPISQLLPQLKYYQAENSEAKFFRHRPNLIWHDEHAAWPKHMGVVNRERILYQDYKYRTPSQIQTRLDAGEKNWQDELVSKEKLYYDDNTIYQIDEEKLPNHLESLPKRTFKKVMHRSGFWA